MSITRAQAQKRIEEAGFAAAFLRADYIACSEMLAIAPPSPEMGLAAARLALAEGRYHDVLGLLGAFPRTAAAPLRRERTMLLGANSVYTKDFVAAQTFLDTVLAQFGNDENNPMRYDALFYKALGAQMAHDNAGAEALVKLQFASPDPNHRGRAHRLMAMVASNRLDVAGEVEELNIALDEFEKAENVDQRERAMTLGALAEVAREMPLTGSTERIRETYERIAWTDALQKERNTIVRALGMIDALNGDYLSAFRHLKRFADSASTREDRIQALVDRAYLAQTSGERAFFDEQLNEAHLEAQEIHWDDMEPGSRAALLVLAQLFAPLDGVIANKYLMTYRSVKPMHVEVTSADLRAKAVAAYSAGVAWMTLGDREEAERLLVDAWSIFESFSFAWRAARCGVALAHLTGDDKWLERAGQRIRPWPKSWIASDVAKARARAGGVHVSPRQREVLELVLQGKQNAEIARATGLSFHSARNYVSQILKIFNVRTRAELVAQYAQHGELPG